MQFGKVRAAAEQFSQIAGERANVIAAAGRSSAIGFFRQIVAEPAGFVKINARRRHDHGFAAMSL
jgi:hypothetical protein